MELLPEGTEFRLIYRGSIHSMKASSFHKNCDNQGPTFTIILSKEKGKVFGGYTDISITSTNQYKQGKGNSFLFRMSGQNNFRKLKCINSQKEVFHYSDRMLCFGGGHDLYISNDCSSNTKSYSDLGDSYEAPDGFKYQSG